MYLLSLKNSSTNANSENEENFNTSQPCQGCLWDAILIIYLAFKKNPKENFQIKSFVLKLLFLMPTTKQESQTTFPHPSKAHSNAHNGIMGLSALMKDKGMNQKFLEKLTKWCSEF